MSVKIQFLLLLWCGLSLLQPPALAHHLSISSPLSTTPPKTSTKNQPQAPPQDRDRDGYPDAVELHGTDRLRFADWFASIAASQYYGISPDWKLQDQDCSGLLRYAYAEALKPHTPKWFAKFKYLPPPRHASVQAYRYPVPQLSRSLFRVTGGTYKHEDVDKGHLVGRTTVQYLANYSTLPISRHLKDAKRGDLLFFIRPQRRNYHSMVYLGDGKVVYHTGANPAEGGKVRLLKVDTLIRYADPAFHPVASNPHFLGVYRWKILLGE